MYVESSSRRPHHFQRIEIVVPRMCVGARLPLRGAA
jgi:hypothetical protein